MHEWRTRRLAVVTIVLIVPLVAWPQEGNQEPTVEFDELQEVLRTVRPAPEVGWFYPPSISESPSHRQRLSHDLRTGRTTVAEESTTEPISTVPPGHPARPLRPAWQGGTEEPALEVRHMPEGAEKDCEGDRSCTAPSRFLYSHDFPWSTTYALTMRYNVDGTDYYYGCAASSFGSFHLLTAGHCIFNWDPNGDGDTSDAQWAQEVWAAAAQTDVVNPIGSPDRPFSFAKATLIDVYGGWVYSGDWDYDLGYIALDRRIGNSTSWMGREEGVTTTGLNFNGYPIETPYVPSGELCQYPGYDAGNVLGYTTYRIQMCAYTYGGHSGGPVWRYDTGSGGRFVQGVNSTSTRQGYAEATRLDAERLGHMNGRIATDEIERPPIARPDLNEFLFSYADDTKDLYPTTVDQGGTFFVKYSLINSGFANSGVITVDFYLSDNLSISIYDTFVGSATLLAIDGGYYYIVPDMPLVANVSPGTYYVGWIMRGTVPEYGGDFDCAGQPCSNVVVVGDEQLTVLVSDVVFNDGFESGNTSGWDGGTS